MQRATAITAGLVLLYLTAAAVAQQSGSQTILRWTASARGQVAHYEVMQSRDLGGGQIADWDVLTTTTATSVALPTIPAGERWLLRVVAVSPAGNRSEPSTVCAATRESADQTVPSAPGSTVVITVTTR